MRTTTLKKVAHPFQSCVWPTLSSIREKKTFSKGWPTLISYCSAGAALSERWGWQRAPSWPTLSHCFVAWAPSALAPPWRPWTGPSWCGCCPGPVTSWPRCSGSRRPWLRWWSCSWGRGGWDAWAAAAPPPGSRKWRCFPGVPSSNWNIV